MDIIINETGESVTLRVLDDNNIDYFGDLSAGDQCIVYDRDAEVYRADRDTVEWWQARVNDIYAVEQHADMVAHRLGTTRRHVLNSVAEAGDALDESYRQRVIRALDTLESLDDLSY